MDPRKNRSVNYPEGALWLAVIERAWRDAHNKQDRNHKFAQEWFLNNDENFQLVCSLAYLEPQYVRELMVKKISKKETTCH